MIAVSETVKREEEAIVVEHFLEVGDTPGAVGGIAHEAARNRVKDPAVSHFFQG
jgi:hypothetical protein